MLCEGIEDEEMNIKIALLKEHPKNKEFFDDMNMEQLEDLKKSIQEQGVIHPLVVTGDYKVISGHQRLRTLRELGKSNAEVIIKHFDSEEQEINALIDANIQSRQGLSGLSPIKIFNIMEFKKNYYGIYHGNHKGLEVSRETSKPKTIEDLANEFGMTLGQLKHISQIKKLTPEFQELIENGSISFGTLKGTVTKLSHQEQQELLNTLGVDKIVESNRKELERLTNELRNEQNKPPKVIEKVKEVQVIPQDYQITKELARSQKEKIDRIEKQLKEKESSIKNFKEKEQKTQAEIGAYEVLKKELRELSEKREGFVQELKDIKLITEMIVEAEKFLTHKLAPIKYSESIKRINKEELLVNRLTDLFGRIDEWKIDIQKEINNEGVVEVKWEEK